MSEHDLRLGDGRVLHVYDTGPGAHVVVWHHGTPNLGTPPGPLLADAARLGIRFVPYDRPGYGTSTPVPGAGHISVLHTAPAVVEWLSVAEPRQV